MKTIILFIAFLTVSSVTFAHQVEQSCFGNNKVKIKGSDFQDGKKTYVKATLQNGTWGNGTFDTIFKLSDNYEFTIYVPANAWMITFENTNHNGNASGEVYCVTIINCNSLPLVFGKIKAKKLSNTEGQVTFTVHSVENVSHINLKVSLDHKIYYTRAVVFPIEGKEEKTYSINFKL